MTESTTERRCSCCDLPVEMCGRAAERAAAEEAEAERQRALAQPGVVAAQYSGTCATCSHRYPMDAPIFRSDDGWSGALCCPDVARSTR